MRFFQNLLITHNTWVIWKVFFELQAFSYIRMGLILAKRSSWCHLRKCSLFWFWVSCLYTFNPLSLKWVTTLVAATYRNMESRQYSKTTYMMRIKESVRRLFFFIFRLNVLHDSYQEDETVKEIASRNGNKKF